MKSLLKGLAPLVLFLLTCSGEAVGDPVGIDPVWKFTATNNTGMIVDGVQLIFAGTGGSIMNPMVVMNAPGAGNPTVMVINPGNSISVSWGAPGLPVGGSFMVQFSTTVPFNVEFSNGTWLPQQQPVNVARDNASVQKITVPEPFTLLLLATGLAGVGINSRKKLRGGG